MAAPIKVLVTGAAGQIAYSLVFPIAKGELFGPNQPIILHLLDIAAMQESLGGVVFELQDCAYPLLRSVVATTNVQEAFTDIDYCLMVGAFPRREGMERKDLLKINTSIFKEQGKALDTWAKKTVKVLVVGNPANTNCLVAQLSAPSIPKENFTALTRLDHNRAKAQIALRLNVPPNTVHNTFIWGNHSSTQYPDPNHGYVGSPDKYIRSVVGDDAWLNGDFIKTVQQRGAAIIKARKLSSAGSAANAIMDHVRDWVNGSGDEIISMAVTSDGNPYGIPEGLIFSFPVRTKNGKWEIVSGLKVDDFSRKLLDTTTAELQEEKTQALEFLTPASL
jgi:malate dehydrogenase